MKDYKDTLLIKETKFEMRGNLPQKDPLFINKWQTLNLYEKLSSRNSTEFILHDGPPYANGSIHIGHALNKILKDIIVRYNAFIGKKINFLLGWDTHGLPIETQLQKNNIKISEIGLSDYLTKAREYALGQISKQNEDFKRLALLTDHSKRYQTLDKEFEHKEIKIFHKMLNDNFVYQTLKPVYWSWSSTTSLADAEIEYEELESNSIYVAFKHEQLDLNFIIWTTTPWTLNANLALAFGKNIQYCEILINTKKYIVALSTLEKLKEKIKNISFVTNFDMKSLINTFAINPINGNKSKLVYGHHIKTDDGTGIVHIAGGHGPDDYVISKENNLNLIVVLNEKGILINSGEFDGQFYLKAEEGIINKLGESCLHHHKMIHKTPVDWRTKKPVVYRATKQWFVSIKKIQTQLIESINKVEWLPKWGNERLSKMMLERDEWCISRQRVWGVPIPIIYDQENNPIINIELQKRIENLFLEKGSKGWFETDIKEIIGDTIPFKESYRKELDILDVWFDSGSSHLFVLGDKQADIYIEGLDQFRGWFNSSLITSQLYNGRAPYKKVITHGFTNDANGKKMSKSLGNTVDPINLLNKFGADILRLWVASSDYTDSVVISDNIINQIVTDYRKIRNTIKFLLSNLQDYKSYELNEFSLINKIILDDVAKAKKEINESFKEFNFSKIIKKILVMLSIGSIAYYLDFAKDILYIEKEDSSYRREVQFVLNQILELLFLLAPIIPVTIEEAFEIFKNDENISIFENSQNYFVDYKINDLNLTWEKFDEFRQIINKELEIKRNEKTIKRSQEANIDFYLPQQYINILNKENNAQIFLVANINLIPSEKIEAQASILIGQKCERCWNNIIKDKMQDDEICKRCFNVLN